MQGSPGAILGSGYSADVHVWAPGQVVKLFKPGFPQRIAQHEARMARAAFAAGAPAPEVFAEVACDGRHGIVMAHLDGPTLLDLSRRGTLGAAEVGGILASLAIAVHATPPPPEVLTLRAWMGYTLRGADARIPPHVRPGILPLIDHLPQGDALCHCDLHPGNVILTAQGPRLVDWFGALRAPAALDLAICHVLLFEHTAEHVPDPARPRAYHAALQSEYAERAGMTHPALTAAIAPYIPIASLFGLLGGWHRHPEVLVARIEAAIADAGIELGG